MLKYFDVFQENLLWEQKEKKFNEEVEVLKHKHQEEVEKFKVRHKLCNVYTI